jgi:hypothetical protein
MDRGEELCSPTTELMAKLVSDEITKQRVRLGEADAGGSRCTRLLSGA